MRNVHQGTIYYFWIQQGFQPFTIKTFGLAVAKKPYLIKTLRLALKMLLYAATYMLRGKY